MVYIGEFKETSGDGYPSIAELISEMPHPEKQRIVNYLRSGRKIAAAAGSFKDALTGSVIPTEALVFTDGTYVWQSDLTYYVEKYNLTLPGQFVKHILEQ